MDGKILDYVVPPGATAFFHIRTLKDRRNEVSFKVIDPQANGQVRYNFNSIGKNEGEYEVWTFTNPWMDRAYPLILLGQYKAAGQFYPCIARNNGTDSRGPFYQWEMPPESGGFNDIECLIADRKLN